MELYAKGVVISTWQHIDENSMYNNRTGSITVCDKLEVTTLSEARVMFKRHFSHSFSNKLSNLRLLKVVCLTWLAVQKFPSNMIPEKLMIYFK